MQRRILHLDIDAFLASIEQLVEPALLGQPVAVGSGVVASRSYEAKARGVQTAMTMREARRLCPELVVRDGDARLAERCRQRVADILRDHMPLVQVCSLDDMYGDLTGLPLGPGGYVELAEKIRAEVRVETGLSVAQGIGATKTVARMATVHAKPGGILEILAGGEGDFLAPHAVEDLPGIGRRTAELLHDLNLHTVGDLLQVEQELLCRTFGARGEEIYFKVRGLDQAPVENSPPIQSINRETSFAASADYDFLLGMLFYLLDRAATELRTHGFRARTVQVRLRHSDGMGREIRRSRKQASDCTDELFALARPLLDRLLERRVLVRLVGVSLSKFEDVRTCALLRQGELFGNVFATGGHQSRQRSRLFKAIDRVRQRYGFGKLILGPAADLLGQVENSQHGFRLRTPSLTK